MRRFTLVVFPDEIAAFRGFHALEELHRMGSVCVYASALVERDDDGVVAVRRRSQAAPLGAGLGAFVGGGSRSELLEFVTGELAPGAFAVVAELRDARTTRLDEPMERLGGRVVCEWWKNVPEDALERRTRLAGERAARAAGPVVPGRGRRARN
jgi:hypothetical protein